MKIAKISLAMVILLVSAALGGVPGAAAQPEPPQEYTQCQSLVEEFWQAWTQEDYPAMYQMLTMQAKLRTIREEFIGQFQRYKIVESELFQHPLLPLAAAQEEGKMAIAAELRPQQEPVEEDVVTGFELELIFEEGQGWKIAHVHVLMPLAASPGS